MSWPICVAVTVLNVDNSNNLSDKIYDCSLILNCMLAKRDTFHFSMNFIYLFISQLIIVKY